MDILQSEHTVVYYWSDERLYGYHPNWKRWNKRADTKPKHPDPPTGIPQIVSIQQQVREIRQAQKDILQLVDAGERNYQRVNVR